MKRLCHEQRVNKENYFTSFQGSIVMATKIEDETTNVPEFLNIPHPSTSNRPAQQGHEYENKILVLCYLDLYDKYNNSEKGEYQACIGAEIKDVATFEDTIYAQVQAGAASICYVQAKHSEQKTPIRLDELLSNSSDKISLLSYFKCHREIKNNIQDNKIEWLKTIKKHFNSLSESHTFIIFTNRPLQNEKQLGLDCVSQQVLFNTNNIRKVYVSSSKEAAKRLLKNEITNYFNEVDNECNEVYLYELIAYLQNKLQCVSMLASKKLIDKLREHFFKLPMQIQDETEKEITLYTKRNKPGKACHIVFKSLSAKLMGIVEEVTEECFAQEKHECKWYRVNVTNQGGLYEKTVKKVKDAVENEIRNFFVRFVFSINPLNLNKLKEELKHIMHFTDINCFVDSICAKCSELNIKYEQFKHDNINQENLDTNTIFYMCANIKDTLYCIPRYESNSIHQKFIEELENPDRKITFQNLIEISSFNSQNSSSINIGLLENEMEKQHFVQADKIAKEIIKWSHQIIKNDEVVPDPVPETVVEGMKIFTCSHRGHKLCQVEISEKAGSVYQDIINKVKDNIVAQVKGFFDEFVFAVDQPNVRELKLYTEQRFNDITGFEMTEHMVSTLSARIADWSMKSKGKLTNEHAHLCFNYMKQLIAHLGLFGITSEKLGHIYRLNIKFDEKSKIMIQLRKFFTDKYDNLQLFVLCYEHLELSMIKLAQAIQNAGVEKKTLILKANNIINNSFDTTLNVIPAFQSKQCNFLYIKTQTEKELTNITNSNTFKMLFEELNGNRDKRIIFIMPSILKSTLNFIEEKHYCFEDQENSFCNLTKESQERICHTAELVFLGQKLDLRLIIDEDLKNNLHGELLRKLIANETITLLDSPIDEYKMEVKHVYIDRQLFRLTKINARICQQDKDFEILHTDEKITSNLNDKDILFITTIDEDSSKYYELCKTYPDANIHWLVENIFDLEGSFFWQMTQGSFKNILKFANSCSAFDYIKEGTVKDKIIKKTLQDSHKVTDDRIVIVVAEPGMGKSSLLADLAEHFKSMKEYAGFLCIKTCLSGHCTFFNAIRSNGRKVNINDAIQFMMNSINIKFLNPDLFKPIENNVDGKICLNLSNTNFDTLQILHLKIFCYFYNQKKIIMLIDSFDEIVPGYEDQVLGLLKVLKDTLIHKMWVTTRPFSDIVINLESKLDTLSFAILPLNDIKQKELLNEHWRHLIMMESEKEKLQTFITIFKYIAMPGVHKLEERERFMRIPLHIEMLAMVYEDNLRKYLQTGALEIDSNINTLYHLFNTFFDLKFFKRHTNSLEPEKQQMNAELQNKRKKVHGKLALLTLFEDFDGISEKIVPKHMKQKLVNNVIQEKIGIVYMVDNTRPQFIHRTYAEYFAADLVAEIILKKKCGFEVLRDFLYCINTENSFSFRQFMIFLNYAIIFKSEIPNHNKIVLNAAVKGDLSNESDQEIKDGLGRTPLHLAFCKGVIHSYEVINLLTKFNKHLFTQDDLFKWTPLNYATMSDNGFNFSDPVHKYYVNHLPVIEYSAYVNSQDVKGCTALHHAIAQDSIYMIDLTLRYGADTTIENVQGITAAEMFYSKFLDDKNKHFDHRIYMLNSFICDCMNKSVDYGHWKPLFLCWAKNKENMAYFISTYKEITHCLLEYEVINANERDSEGNTLLYLAAITGNVQMMNYLYQHGFGTVVNIYNENTTKNSHNIATINDSYYNFNKNLNPYNEDAIQVLPLFFNVMSQTDSDIIYHMSKYNNIATCLLENELININSKDEGGKTALHHASAEYSERGISSIYFLLQHGANVYTKDNNGMIPAQILAERPINLDTLNKDTECHARAEHILQFLESLAQCNEIIVGIVGKYPNIGLFLIIHNLFSINKIDTKGDIALRYISDDKVMTKFIKLGAKFDLVPETLLHKNHVLKCIVNIFDQIKTGCNKGISQLFKEDLPKELINAKSRYLGKRPIHWAIEKRNKEIVKLLLSFGAFYNVPDDKGQMPLNLAIDTDVIRILNLTDSLFKAIREGRTDDIETLINKGAVVNAREFHIGNTNMDEEGTPALHLAVKNGNYDIANILLYYGADKYSIRNGTTLLHIACKSKEYFKESVEYLLTKFTREELTEIMFKSRDLFDVVPFEIASANNNDISVLLPSYGVEDTSATRNPNWYAFYYS